MIKIAIITSTRADYGLLSSIIRALHTTSGIDPKLIATGTHLSHSHGMTLNEIIADGIHIDAKIPLGLESDQRLNLTASLGTFTKELAYQLDRMEPDAVLILGDRFEMLPVAYTAAMMNIKLIHIHGGELTLGAIDNKMRFSISHLSDFHITATVQSKQRLVQCGISPETVIMAGALGVENALKMKKLSRSEIEDKTGAKFCDQNILFTFHPETISNYSIEEQIDPVLSALGDFNNLGKFMCLPNADPGNHIIVRKLNDFRKNSDNVHLIQNLGHHLYLSLMNEVNAVVGNSSSGIIEAPALGIPTVNIGNRQKGREQAKSVFACEYNSSSIKDALAKSLSQKIAVPLQQHPYYHEGTCAIIISAIKKYLSASTR